MEETSALRLEEAAREVRLVDRIAASEASLRLEMGALRGEIGDLRKDLNGLRVEIASSHFSTVKWAFAFSVGQLAAMAGLLAVFR